MRLRSNRRVVHDLRTGLVKNALFTVICYGKSRRLSANVVRRICLKYAHLFGLEQNLIASEDIRKNSHYNAYSRFDEAILDNPCKASPHDALLHP